MLGGGQWGAFNLSNNTFRHVKPIAIDYQQPFRIEASCTFEGGFMPHYYSIIFGSNQEGTSYQMFSLNGKHQFTVSETNPSVTSFHRARKPENLIINELNVAYTLTILKKSDRSDPNIYFMINQQEVFKTDQLKLIGDYIGFFIGSRMIVAIDYLSVVQMSYT